MKKRDRVDRMVKMDRRYKSNLVEKHIGSRIIESRMDIQSTPRTKGTWQTTRTVGYRDHGWPSDQHRPIDPGNSFWKRQCQ